MITLTTIKDGQSNRYIRSDTDNRGRETLHRESAYRIVKVPSASGYDFSLMDEEGRTNPDFHKFINATLVKCGMSLNTRRTYAHVLCKFHAFLELMGYTVYNLGLDEVYKLRAFLKSSGKTECCNETVNTYLAVIREFFTCLGVKCEPLSLQHNVLLNSSLGEGFLVQSRVKAYDVSLPKNAHKEDHVPRYISLDEYIALQKLARKLRDWTAIILMHLMFRYGMRLGECLGLTEEDVATVKIEGKDVPALILRNRISDAQFQKAKRRFSPASKSDYQGQTYTDQWKNDSNSIVTLTESSDSEFVQAFHKYIREAHETAETLHPQNYKKSEADIVCPEEFKKKGLKKNHYIFVNRLGKRLSEQMWGKQLKQYFVKVGIPIDSEKKKNNLSHRFRHGYAMMHARFMDPPVPPQELQRMLRHRRITSVMRYYNPTIEDEYEYKTKMQERFYEMNKSMNDMLTDFLNDDSNLPEA